MSLAARLLRTYLRTNLRGRTRLTFFLARRLRAFQAVPILIKDHPYVYLDLRFGYAHQLLWDSPYEGPPREPDEQSVMRRVVRESDVAYDIGVHFGFHAALLSRLVAPGGRVCAFEPNEQLYPSLTRTLAELPNAKLYPLALSDAEQDATLFVPEDVSMASLADWTGERGATRQIKCRMRRLDDLVERGEAPAPDFVKCDVEGAELSVFRGARRTLERREAPIILFEVNAKAASAFGQEKTAALDFLSELDAPRYEFFEVREGGRLEPVERVGSDFANVLAVPRARRSRLADES
ncbi:MAG TPA: FkbM family methyltransferase [Pyrinomonadaceae bacterium]|nr:FkbM family methyltransferase [Pyrinomonadaceae bacterium]